MDCSSPLFIPLAISDVLAISMTDHSWDIPLKLRHMQLFSSSNSPTKCMIHSFNTVVLIDKICNDKRKIDGRKKGQMSKSHNRSKSTDPNRYYVCVYMNTHT